jgi:hypothetical protein
MCLYLEGRRVKANGGFATFEDMEAAFQYLKPLGTLELNKASVRQQEARAINERNAGWGIGRIFQRNFYREFFSIHGGRH